MPGSGLHHRLSEQVGMSRADLQDEFEMMEGVNEQGYFIDQNLEYASDVALANELNKRGFRVRI